jgi:hypothetical protein
MVAFDAYVHKDIQELDVKFVMHVKVTHVWMEEHANPPMEMLAINVSVLVALVVNDVKSVCMLHDFIHS